MAVLTEAEAEQYLERYGVPHKGRHKCDTCGKLLGTLQYRDSGGGEHCSGACLDQAEPRGGGKRKMSITPDENKAGGLQAAAPDETEMKTKAEDKVKKQKAVKPKKEKQQAKAPKESTKLAVVKSAKAKKPAKAKAARKPQPKGDLSKVREGSKKYKLLTLLRRNGGATLAQLAAATGWPKETCSAYYYGSLSRLGLKRQITENKSGDRVFALLG